jgi:2-amino-4-hydroxy-6-hydroxymethyldihydropteridine diphosphokinase
MSNAGHLTDLHQFMKRKHGEILISHPFLNQALEISTSLNARQLMRKVLKIEEEMGRVRKENLDQGSLILIFYFSKTKFMICVF